MVAGHGVWEVCHDRQRYFYMRSGSRSYLVTASATRFTSFLKSILGSSILKRRIWSHSDKLLSASLKPLYIEAASKLLKSNNDSVPVLTIPVILFWLTVMH
jgi:hypothetical protein